MLQYGTNKAALDYPHFPARFQAVIWRNWGMVPRERLAKILRTDLATLDAQAALMGLTPDDSLCARWLKRGYQTIIRQNWHLLDYPDLLVALDWSAEQLDFTLREDDFLWIKMGFQKPVVPPCHYQELTAEQYARTIELAKEVQPYMTEDNAGSREKPFDFLHGHSPYSAIPNDTPGIRMIYSYSALYGDPLLDESLEPFPEEELESYAASGINAVWMHSVLYQLIPWLGDDFSLSQGWQKRIESLKQLCVRLAKKGISLILYVNEPRALPEEYFKEHPDWKGSYLPDLNVYSICTSNPEVLTRLQDAMKRLFTLVPELGGVFIITRSENVTNCWSHYSPDYEPPCPRCLQNGMSKVISDVIRAIASGVHSAKPSARVFAWNWAWRTWDVDIIKLLPKDVTLLSVSENQRETNVGGFLGAIEDYSISKPGPGPTARRSWQAANEAGLPIAAKVQVNNSWEMASVPYLPVPGLVEEHITNLRNQGIGDFMLSWSMGGYPGCNLRLLTCTKQELTKMDFGDASSFILAAYSCFESGFRHFPFHLNVGLYCGPHNIGPGNLFFERPTGYRATMIAFPYDDLKSWRAIYPEEVFENEYRVLCDYWRNGLEMLEEARGKITQETQLRYKDLCSVSYAAYYHFFSAYLHIRFVRLRDSHAPKEQLVAVLTQAMENAVELLRLSSADSRLGYEASNHYFYTRQMLLESIMNCKYLIQRFQEN